MSQLPYGVIAMIMDSYLPVTHNHYQFYHFIDKTSSELTYDIVDNDTLNTHRNIMATIDCGKYGDEIRIYIKQNITYEELDKNNPGLTDTLQSIKLDSSGFK